MPGADPRREGLGRRRTAAFHVVPEDILVLAPPILGHRLLLTAEATFAGTTVDEVTRALLDSVPAPDDRA